MARESHRIDWVAPPFAGHLFPMLTIAKGLRAAGFERQRVYSTPRMRLAVEGAGLEFRGILAAEEDEIFRIANGDARVGARPTALLRQFKETLGFLERLAEELEHDWASGPPAVAIVDSVLPSAGLTARRVGARWWTSMASLPPVETRTGTPAYLGGWAPGPGLHHRIRDRVGRGLTRGFKRTAGWLARKELRALGVESVYRADGTEACYSDDCILGLGHPEFEFARDWPAAMRFVGYPVGSPLRQAVSPEVDVTRPHVLVTLGTHLLWAKGEALAHARELARLMPDWTVHFSHGDGAGSIATTHGNLGEFSYVPYGPGLGAYQAICHHGGAGITYASLAAGVPALVWPRDFDQFDNAARVAATGAGLPTSGDAADMAAKLRRFETEPGYREAALRLSSQMSTLDPVAETAALLARSLTVTGPVQG